jgi:tetratricopeptide (TPR) repeat protein
MVAQVFQKSKKRGGASSPWFETRGLRSATMLKPSKRAIMAQSLPSQETLSEQWRVLLLTLEKTAQSYFLSGQLEQALQLLQVGIQLVHIPEVTPREQARFKLAYGNMLAIKTNFENAPVENALALLEEAKQLAMTIADDQLIADALNGIGYAHYVAASNKREGDPHMLLAYFQEALERRRALHDDRGISESLFYIGLISELREQKEFAHTSYTQSLEIAQQHGYSREAFEALRHLGFFEQAQGNFSQAQQYFTESLQQLEHAGIQVYLPFAHVVLADACLAQGNVEAASSHCQKALDLAPKMNIKKALIFSLLSSGRICQEKQEHAQARGYFEQAYAVAEAIDLKYAMQWASSALQDF